MTSSFELKSNSPNNSTIGTPTHRHTTSSIEQSRPNLISLEIFLNSTFLHMPSNNFNNIIRLILNLNLMKSISIPIVSLIHISAVEVVLNIVVISEIVCWVDESISHLLLYLIKIYLLYISFFGVFTEFDKCR